MSKQQQNTKAGLYYRLSKDDERAGESLSIENQKRMLEKYATENGFEIVDEYIDDGWSGTNFQRPGVQRLLEDAKNGKINVINNGHCKRPLPLWQELYRGRSIHRLYLSDVQHTFYRSR